MENLKESLKLFHGFAFLYCHGSDSLTAVHRRTAAKGYHCLTSVFSKQLQTFIYITVCGIRLNTVVNYIFDSGSIYGFKHPFREA